MKKRFMFQASVRSSFFIKIFLRFKSGSWLQNIGVISLNKQTEQLEKCVKSKKCYCLYSLTLTLLNQIKPTA